MMKRSIIYAQVDFIKERDKCIYLSQILENGGEPNKNRRASDGDFHCFPPVTPFSPCGEDDPNHLDYFDQAD